MIHQMELAGRRLLLEYLCEGDEGIGARACVDHVSPARVGSVMTVRATLRALQANRVICDVDARVGDRLVGKGEHVQVVMRQDKIQKLIERSS